MYKTNKIVPLCHSGLDPESRSSFTLIELLVVLALVAILSVVVILTLNPAELIKQARDSNRLSDLATINTALNLFSADVTNGFMGTSTIVYVSIPSIISTCSNLGLPTLPSGYTYNCVTAASTRNTDGTGWIPVNFQRISSNSPISQLPIDPINTTSTRLYYTYVSGGSWELNASIEASKNKLGGSGDLVSKDGGSATSQYEIGNNLNLNPIETGDASLVGYWNFEEGPNATSTDRSGYGNHGTWYGTSTAEQHYATGKVGSYAGYFNGSGDQVATVHGSARIINSSAFTIMAQISYETKPSTYPCIICRPGYDAALFLAGSVQIASQIGAGWSMGATALAPNTWYSVATTYDGSTGKIYLNGQQIKTYSYVGVVGASEYLYLGGGAGIGSYNGLIDDSRLYNRALSDAEILSAYNATK